MRRAATARTRISPIGDTGESVGLSRAAGFTLLELLVVLVVLAILAGMAGARIMGALDQSALRATTQELSVVLRRARSGAIVRNAPVSVRIDVATLSFGIPGERVYKASERLRLSVFTSVTQRLTENVGEIRFFPDGSSTGGEVTVADDQARNYVQIDWLTGQVAVYEEAIRERREGIHAP